MTLYVVATPIGNLADLTARARQVLSSVSLVFAEDTRRIRILLEHLGAHPRLLAYHQHTTPGRLDALLDRLVGEDVALVSDAGTPGVNDPGGVLIARALARFGIELHIIPVPGPCALVTAASISGFPMDEFAFLGFPPHKKGRQLFFERLAAMTGSVIFYESPYRLHRALEALAAHDPGRQIVVCRELTKRFETITRGTVGEVTARLMGEAPRGEYVLVLAPHLFGAGERLSHRKTVA